MTVERNGVLKLGDQDDTIIGEDIKVGQESPDFTAHAQNYPRIPMLASMHVDHMNSLGDEPNTMKRYSLQPVNWSLSCIMELSQEA